MIYFVVFLLSAACLFISPIYWPEYLLSSIFVLIGIGVLTTQIKINFKNLPHRFHLLFIAVPILLIAYIIPYPSNLGFLLLSIGIILTALLPAKKYLSQFSFSLLITGLILSAVSIINPLFNIVVSRVHDISLINFFVNPLLKLLSLDSLWNYGNLYIQSLPELEWILTTTEKTGIYFSLVFFIGAAITILIFRQNNKVKTLLLLFAIQFGYIILRYAFMIIIFLNSGKANIFWDRWIEIITFIPLILILYKFIPIKNVQKTIKIRFERFVFRKKQIPAVVYISLFVFFVSALALFHEPGELKNGRVILDEYHSDWEWTEKKLDTSWYGKKSLYNYYCLADYISHYYQFERNFNVITDDLLTRCDILILKTPTSPYKEEEIESIEKFVYDGGGLLLIGDHTNVFGTSTFINPIAKKFGLEFNYDATYDFKTGSLSVYKAPEFYSHPVVQFMPPLLFGTSCTLEAPLMAENIIMGYGLKSAYLDYSKKNFFSQQNESASIKYGLFLQSAGVKHGKGRVIAFTDSTIFSNFWMFMPGKSELFLGFLNWLNRMNTIFSFISILIIFCLLFIWMARNQLKKFTFIQNVYLISITGGLVFVLSYFLFSSLKFSSYAVQEPTTNYYRICFDNEYSDIDMPITTLTQDYYKSYNTFYISLQRLGYFPSIINSIEESLKDNDLVIIINSKKEFPEFITKKMSSFLNGGGKLLILEDHYDETQFSSKLLARLDVDLTDNTFNNMPTSTNNIPPSTTDQENSESENEIGENKKIIRTNQGKSLPPLEKYKLGKGEIYVLYNSHLYNDINMGIANAVPNKDQLKNNRLIYNLIEFIVKDE